MTAEKKAYSYVRMSSAQQLHGDSLRRQTEAAENYARLHGLTLDETLTDLGKSAYSGEHRSVGVLGEFLSRLKRGEIPSGSYLLVESLDRLSRESPWKAVQLLQTIVEAGVVIVTLSDTQQYHDLDDFSQMMLSILTMYRGHQESQLKSQRIGASWRAKRSTAKVKRITSVCPKWLEPDKANGFSIIPERAALVRRIFEDSANGVGAYTIARNLNSEAVPTFGRSAGWQPSSIKKILKNRAVLGEFQPHEVRSKRRIPSGDPIAGYFPAIVEEFVFAKSNAGILTRRQRGGGRTGGFVYLFKRILFCAKCGGKVRFLNKGSNTKGGRYLACDNGQRLLHCTNKLWRYDNFEAAFLFHTPLALGMTQIAEVLENKRDVSKEQLLVAQDRLHQLAQQADAIDASFAEAGDISERSKKKRADLERMIVEQEAAVNKLRSQPTPQFPESTNSVDELVNRLKETGTNAETTLRSRVSQLVSGSISRIDVSLEGLDPFFDSPWRDRIDGDWADAEDAGLFSEEDPYLRAPAFAVQFKEWLGGRLVQAHPHYPPLYRVAAALRPVDHEHYDPQSYRTVALLQGKKTHQPWFAYNWLDDPSFAEFGGKAWD